LGCSGNGNFWHEAGIFGAAASLSGFWSTFPVASA
jgi:hypothetical protein